MSIGAGIATGTAILALIGGIIKIMPSKAIEPLRDHYLEKIIEIAEKLSKSMAIIQSKSESIHHSVKNIDAVGKLSEQNMRSRMDMQAQKMAGMEEKVELIWKATVK